MMQTRFFTVTWNPAVDCYYPLKAPLVFGKTNRSFSVLEKAGGKGLNAAIAVAKALKRLNPEKEQKSEVFAYLLSGNAIYGDLCRKRIQDEGLTGHLRTFFSGESHFPRRALKLGFGSLVTEVNEEGGFVGEQALGCFLGELLSEVNAASEEGLSPVVLLCGSLPPGMDCEKLKTAILLLKEFGAYIALDGGGEILRAGLSVGVDLIKPNEDELRELAFLLDRKRRDRTPEEVCHALSEEHSVEILCTLGEKGAFLKTEGGDLFRVAAEDIASPITTVGAGDSMLGSYLAARAMGQSRGEALRFASAFTAKYLTASDI